uniref:Uncharacterized protein n=1 Tax=Plectus sambesii TaxID=2011161 RepID=A0A914X1Q7_9BILA
MYRETFARQSPPSIRIIILWRLTLKRNTRGERLMHAGGSSICLPAGAGPKEKYGSTTLEDRSARRDESTTTIAFRARARRGRPLDDRRGDANDCNCQRRATGIETDGGGREQKEKTEEDE